MTMNTTMMEIYSFLLHTTLFLILLIAFLVVLIGGLWVLRVAIFWWLEIDYVESIKRRLKHAKNNRTR